MTRKLIIAGLLVAGVLVWLGLSPGLGLPTLQQVLETIRARTAAEPALAAGAFGVLYVLIAVLSVPGGAAILTPAAGAIFGLAQGTLIVSFASTIGATLSFLAARFLFREFIELRFGRIADRVNRGIREEGAYYLLAVRLVPIFPFFAVNPVMGLTRLPVHTFYWVSQLGMLPATLILVNAGAQLGRIESISGVFSPGLIGSLALLAVFPLLTRRLLATLRNRRVYARFRRPRRYDANLVVIGGGAAGLVTAYVAAAARARVVLVEADRMGGECLNSGCVPSKALIRSARIARHLSRAGDFGLRPVTVQPDFEQVMARVREAIARIEPHDSVERYRSLGVECVKGRARITSPWTVAVDGREISTRSIAVATGGSPVLPPIPGLKDVPHVTSDSIWELAALPGRLLVLGGGAIGCELGQAFRHLGSQVTLVEALPRLLPREDEDASAFLAAELARDGIQVLTGTEALAFQRLPGGGRLRYVQGGVAGEADFDMVLVAAGRRARTDGLGLAELGIALNPDGTLAVDEYLQSTLPQILACGDAAGPFQLTHAAAHQAWYCAMNALWGRFWRWRVDYSVIPRAVFTEPEVARVGLTADEARQAGLQVEITRYDLAELDRALVDGEARGFVKVVTPRGRDRILGATIVGPRAGDIIGEFSLGMRHGLGLRQILGTVHIYPTYAEAVKFAAGEWQRQHLPAGLLGLAERLNRRARGR